MTTIKEGDELARLRDALIRCGRTAGAILSDEVSNDFLMLVPAEVEAKIARSQHNGVTQGDKVLREACLIIGGFLDLGQQDALVRRARVWLDENPELECAALSPSGGMAHE